MYDYIKRFKHISSKRGFTLLIAALVASIVLTIASAIFSIAQKQVTLASLSQQSQYAFYAADTAAECALYWDIRYAYFAQTTPSGAALPTPPVCDTLSIALTKALSNQSYPYKLCPTGDADPTCLPGVNIPPVNLFSSQSPPGYCVEITVLKCQGSIKNGVCVAGLPTDPVATKIHADGFNVACAAIATSPTALERSVELNY
jgi:hypothetical protein